MKFKLLSSILILLIIASFSFAIYLSLELQKKNVELIDTNKELEEKNVLIENINTKIDSLEKSAREELEKCLSEGNRSLWEVASRTNTLVAYSNFVKNCNSAESDCHEQDLKNAIDALLNSKGYVQIIETNGNPLFTKADDLSLDGEFIKFKTDRSVRNGAIGKDIENCGLPNPKKTGIVLKDKIVKVLKKCEASSSKSVWAQIQYAN